MPSCARAVDRDKLAEDWHSDPTYKKPAKSLAEGAAPPCRPLPSTVQRKQAGAVSDEAGTRTSCCDVVPAVLDDSASVLFMTEIMRGMAYTLGAFFDKKVTVRLVAIQGTGT